MIYLHSLLMMKMYGMCIFDIFDHDEATFQLKTKCSETKI